jgi:hypothetical protein
VLQAAQATVGSSGPSVLKEQVFPLFESAGRMFVALKGERFCNNNCGSVIMQSCPERRQSSMC